MLSSHGAYPPKGMVRRSPHQ
jgi:hypothetical protein